MATDARHDIGEIAARLGRLEDERAILNVLFHYPLAMDHGTETEWLDLFTDDAVYDVYCGEAAIDMLTSRGATPHAKGARFSGKAALTKFIAARNRSTGRESKHFFTQPVVALNGDEAEVESYYIAAAEDNGQRDIYSIGRNLDRFVRCADGRWRFRSRVSLPANAPSYP